MPLWTNISKNIFRNFCHFTSKWHPLPKDWDPLSKKMKVWLNWTSSNFSNKELALPITCSTSCKDALQEVKYTISVLLIQYTWPTTLHQATISKIWLKLISNKFCALWTWTISRNIWPNKPSSSRIPSTKTIKPPVNTDPSIKLSLPISSAKLTRKKHSQSWDPSRYNKTKKKAYYPWTDS